MNNVKEQDNELGFGIGYDHPNLFPLKVLLGFFKRNEAFNFDRYFDPKHEESHGSYNNYFMPWNKYLEELKKRYKI